MILVLVAVFLVWCGTTVKLGEYTCLGHVKRIWDSEETKDLREGVKEKATSESTKELVDDVKDSAKPVVDRVKRGVKAGVDEAEKPGEDPKPAAEEPPAEPAPQD